MAFRLISSIHVPHTAREETGNTIQRGSRLPTMTLLPHLELRSMSGPKTPRLHIVYYYNGNASTEAVWGQQQDSRARLRSVAEDLRGGLPTSKRHPLLSG